MAPPLTRPGGWKTNLAVGAALVAFVGGTYWKVIHNVSSDDLERELEREIAGAAGGGAAAKGEEAL